MALVECKDCKAQISTDAKSCPQCGAINAVAYRGVRLGGLIYLALLGALFYWLWGLMSPDARGQVVTEAEFGTAWPFTVPQVELLCEGLPPVALAKTEDGKLYALNGSARTQGQANGWLDGYDITKPHPGMPQIKMNYSDLVEIAMAPCIAENTARN